MSEAEFNADLILSHTYGLCMISEPEDFLFSIAYPSFSTECILPTAYGAPGNYYVCMLHLLHM
jgi:hypothetical protein